MDGNSVLESCENNSAQVQIIWKNRQEGNKLVQIISPGLEVDWYFKNPGPLEIKPDTFVVDLPLGYKTQAIN